MSRGQTRPSGGHIFSTLACGLHSQIHTWTDSGRIQPWPLTPAWAPSGLTEAVLPSLQRPAPGSLDLYPQCVCVCLQTWGWRRGSPGKWISHLVESPAPSLREIASAGPKGQLSPFLALRSSFFFLFLPFLITSPTSLIRGEQGTVVKP